MASLSTPPNFYFSGSGHLASHGAENEQGVSYLFLTGMYFCGTRISHVLTHFLRKLYHFPVTLHCVLLHPPLAAMHLRRSHTLVIDLWLTQCECWLLGLSSLAGRRMAYILSDGDSLMVYRCPCVLPLHKVQTAFGSREWLGRFWDQEKEKRKKKTPKNA